MPRSSRIDRILERMATAEEEFSNTPFLAPSVRGGKVLVSIRGILCELETIPADFEGWGIFRPQAHHHATLVRQATLSERKSYLDLLPYRQFIVCHRSANTALVIPAHQTGSPSAVDPAPTRLAEGVQLFDIIRARSDGANLWFDALEARCDPGMAPYLRDALSRSTRPDDIRRSGLTPQQRAAYAMNFRVRMRNVAQADDDGVAVRLRAALAHAGARFVEYAEHNDGYRVTYKVGRRRHVSSVKKADLTVQVAGICLSGEDRKFDLNSLVGVLRQSQSGFIAVGDENGGMDEQTYWQIHPPRR